MYIYLLIIFALFMPSLAHSMTEVQFPITAEIPVDENIHHQNVYFFVEGDGLAQDVVGVPAVDASGGYMMEYTYTYIVPDDISVGDHLVSVHVSSVNSFGSEGLAANGGVAGPATLILKVSEGPELPELPGTITLQCSPSPCEIFVVP